jgi:Spy/CpxP family protein refolding chaperone
MKAKWLVLSVAGVLCLAPLAMTARAQERAAPKQVVGEATERPGDSDEGDRVADLDGLDMLLAGDVAAGPGPGDMGPRMHMGPGGGMAGGLREKLNLSGEQKEKLADIHDRQERRAIPIQGDLRIAALDLHKLLRAERSDQRAIDAQIDKLSGLRGSLQKSRVASMIEARAVLTPAQQKLMREEHGGMRGHGMRGGHGMLGRHGMRGGDRMRIMDAPPGQTPR